jgi:hypothetical protein
MVVFGNEAALTLHSTNVGITYMFFPVLLAKEDSLRVCNGGHNNHRHNKNEHSSILYGTYH